MKLKEMFFTTIILIGISIFMSGCWGEKAKKTIDENACDTILVDNNVNPFIGTSWAWSGSVTTIILTFVNDTIYRTDTPMSEEVEGKYKLETLKDGKKVINTDDGQYEIIGETLVKSYEGGEIIFERFETED